MKPICVLLGFLLYGVAHADLGNNEWRWYYVAFSSPEKSADIFLRSGFASVERVKNKIKINFKDKNIPELAPILAGNISEGKVRGVLKNFFMYEEDLDLFGNFRAKQIAKNCAFEEIILQPKEPTGSMLVLSRVTGGCQ